MMAGEKRGLFYEVITYICLRKIYDSDAKKLQVFWNQTPDGMSIDTDLTIGESPDKPTHLFLVSHCTSEHNSDMKFWRNLGELREARLLLPANIKVTCILFDAKFKKNLLTLQKYAYDSFLNVQEQDFGATIMLASQTFAEHLPARKDAKVGFVNELITNNKQLAVAVNSLCESLGYCLEIAKPQNELWSTVRKSLRSRPSPRLPDVLSTTLRRGLAKSLLLEKIPSRGETISSEYVDLGIARKSIKGCVLNDSEIQGAIKLMGRTSIEKLHTQYSDMEQFRILVLPLRSINSFQSFWDFLQKNWSSVTRAASLFELLQESHSSPHKSAGISESACPYIVPGWIVIYLITALKAKSGKRMSFGYSKIVSEIEKLGARKSAAIAKQILMQSNFDDDNKDEPRSSRTIEYGLRDWIFGDSRMNFDLRPTELALICHILSQNVSKIIGSNPNKDLSFETKSFLVKDTIETKLLAHPSFQPLKLMLESELDNRQIEYEDISYFPSPLFGMATANGEKVNVRAGSTNVLLANGCLIRWISVSDAGKTHKLKEFCGRAWGFRIQVQGKSSEITIRKDLRKTILIVDGNFDVAELELLIEAGWDEVYYPNEIAKAIDSVEGMPL